MKGGKRGASDAERASVFSAILGNLGTINPPANTSSTPTLSQLAIDTIHYADQQPRTFIDPIALATLTASVREHGVLEPVLVRPHATGYQLVAGERRTRAAREAGLSHIPAIILHLDDRDALEIAIMENLQREDLNAVEETEAVLLLLELSLSVSREQALALLQELAQEARGRTPAARYTTAQRAAARELFERLGRFSVTSFLANRVPILRFPAELLDAVRRGALAFTKAQALARLDDATDRQRLLREALEHGLSLSQIRRRITELRADQANPRSVHERVLESAHSARKALQRQHLAKLAPEQLIEVEHLLENLLSMLEPSSTTADE